MKYIDSGDRDPSQTFANWFNGALQDDITEFRLQSGFFSAKALGLLSEAFGLFAKRGNLTRILIGSNSGATLKGDVVELVKLMALPRRGGQLGVVSFASGLFHPKAYHVRRKDGSEAALIGSGNFTPMGMALHVEAGIVLDTREGDAQKVVGAVAHAIDRWFLEKRLGFNLVTNIVDVENLTNIGVLSLAPPPVAIPENLPANLQSDSREARPRLKSLISLPKFLANGDSLQARTEVAVESEGSKRSTSNNEFSAAVLSSPRKGFPEYLLFESGAVGPTVGAKGLSGALLPGGAVGLIVRLNKDSARPFSGGEGTANISVPVATVGALRFGIYGKHGSPRAEFSLEVRYVGKTTITAVPTSTNVMGYGFTKTESGHGDIRMLVPAKTAKLGEAIRAAGMPLPQPGDVALLEWATIDQPSFRLSFLDNSAPLGRAASVALKSALSLQQQVGKGACWLSAGFSPIW